MKIHPVAELFPMLPPFELKSLADDIKANGLQQPIVIQGGILLDGRNRLEACKIAEVEPTFKEYGGENIFEFIIGANLHRRHLNESQRAMIAARMANLPAHRPDKSANLPTSISQPEAAKLLNVSERLVRDAKTIEHESPEMVEQISSGKTTVNKARTIVNTKRKHEELIEAQKIITDESRKDIESVCDIRVCSCMELFKSGIKPDAVITDPPYPGEFLPAFSELAESCKMANVPLVAVMSGQSYLPEVMKRLCEHLDYRWTLAYMTPGPSCHLWQKKIDSAWKPVLLFGGDENIMDVFNSDKQDKIFHEWGQSESGMADLVGRLTKPGQLVCDPFLGGGTTAIVSLKLGRRFVGCDIDNDCIISARQRIEVAISKT